MKEKKKKRKNSVQELLGITTFTKYGLMTNRGELLFFQVAPTNISVLSYANIGIKIYHLMMVLSTMPNIEIVCTDATECFDDNKVYLQRRRQEEKTKAVRELIEKDIQFLDQIQVETASSRQFLFVMRIKGGGEKNTFAIMNGVEKNIADQCFEVHRLGKNNIKRLLARYFEASMSGEQMPDADGEQFFQQEKE